MSLYDNRNCRLLAIASILTVMVFIVASLLEMQPVEAQSAAPTDEQLRNMTYPSEFTESGRAPLIDGEYREQAAPGSATVIVVRLTEHVAYGQLNEQDMAAVVLVTDPGGSGVFYDLHVVATVNGQPTAIAQMRLGDRTTVNRIGVEDNAIIVNLLTHGPDDPICCPTLQTEQTFRLQDGRLTLESSVATRRNPVGSLPPASIRIDSMGLTAGVDSVVEAATPYDNGSPPGPSGAPEHNVIQFDGQPVVRIYPILAYQTLWQDQGDQTITSTASQLRQLLAARSQYPALPDLGLPILPPAAGVNDIAAQTAYVDFANGSGIRFVGRVSQDPSPVSGDQLHYYFQGLTDDGDYYVSFMVPISVTGFPQAVEEIPADRLRQIDADFEAYRQGTIAQLNALTNDYAPTLRRLDAVVAALTFDAWTQIQSSGRLIVGTAADYPPFAFYTDDFKLDGLDVALIREIGAQLGVEVVLRHIAFEGLGDALLLGQIDVAIAAISVTPERDEAVDFTNIYYVGDDAVLANEASQLTINSINDVAGLRVGVQRYTVYDDWAQSELVDAGIINENALFIYRNIGAAVRDLAQGRIDLVLLDLTPAQAFVAEGGVKVIAQGLNRQRFAMATYPGPSTDNLRRQLNGALAEMQVTGRVAALIKQYIGLEPEEPPLAAAPAPPPPTPPCINGMGFVQNLNLDDNNMTTPPLIPSGQPFEKGWRVHNVGTCIWDGSYMLSYVGGNSPLSQMNGQPIFVAGTVVPGQFYDFFANLIAPAEPGVYQGIWGMSGKGEPFGDRMWVGIQVPVVPTPVPPPSPTPSPGIQFGADRTNITVGECATIVWRAENVNAVYFYAQGERWEERGVAGIDSRTVCPQATTVYELRVIKSDGSTEIRQMRIDVQRVAGAPEIRHFNVEPAGDVPVGACVVVSWDVAGDATDIQLFANDAQLWGAAPLKGSLQNCPSGAGDVVFTIEVRAAGGTSSAQRQIRVVEATP